MRWLMLSVLIAMTPARAAEQAPGPVSHLKIQAQACVRGPAATLADVLTFVSADPQLRAALAEQPIVSELQPAATVTVDHARIEQRLRELGVNLAEVLLSGAAACEVIALPPAGGDGRLGGRPLREGPSEAAAPAVSGQSSGAGPPGLASSGRSLAEAVQAHVQRELANLGGTVELEFERAGEPFLALTDPPWSFTISSRARERLGLREFRVLLSRDGRAQRSVHLTACVRLSKPVLVARQPLNVGTAVRRDDVTPETRLFERESDIGLHELAQVIGQRVRRFVPAGQMIRPDDLRSEDLVRRSRPVTVIGTAPNIHVRVAAVALDSGGYGETVRVRIGDTRKDHRVLRGVVTGVGTVRIEEEQL